MTGSIAPEIQACAAATATTRADYFRMLDNIERNRRAAEERRILAELDAAVMGATPAEVVALIEAAAERLGAMG